jgi:hypothetical protein
MKKVVKGVVQSCMSTVIGITHPAIANHAEKSALQNGMRNPARDAVLK